MVHVKQEHNTSFQQQRKKHILYVDRDLFSLRLYNNKWHLCGMNLIGKTRKRRKKEEDGDGYGGGETLSDILLKEDTILNDFMPFPM